MHGGPQSGDKLEIETKASQSLFAVVGNIAAGLGQIDQSEQPEVYQDLIDNTIVGLQSATESILGARAELGARFNSIESAKTQHEDLTLQLQQVRSGIEDLDFAEAVSNLAYQSFVLEAAQQSFIA